MPISLEKEDDLRRSNRRQSHRRKTNMEPIKVGGGKDKGQEVTVHCQTAPEERRDLHLAGLKNLQWNGAKLLYSRNRRNHKKGE